MVVGGGLDGQAELAFVVCRFSARNVVGIAWVWRWISMSCLSALLLSWQCLTAEVLDLCYTAAEVYLNLTKSRIA